MYIPSLNHCLPGFQPSDWFNPSPLINPVFSSVRFTDISCAANQAEGRELSRDRKQPRHSYINVVSVGSDSSVTRDYSRIAAGLVRNLTIIN